MIGSLKREIDWKWDVWHERCPGHGRDGLGLLDVWHERCPGYVRGGLGLFPLRS